MKYIVYVELDADVISGHVRIPVGSSLEATGRIIQYHGNPICTKISSIAHQHLVRDNDGQGAHRGELILQIKHNLDPNNVSSKRKYDKRWKLVTNDEICQSYRKSGHEDVWVWDHKFYEAPIADLEHIANLASQ